MISRTHLLWSFGLWTAMAALSAALYPSLPDPAPIHWNFRGEVDGWGPPWILAVLTPAIGLTMIGLLAGLPLLGPLRSNFEQFRVTYGRMCVLLMGMFLAMHAVILASAMGSVRDVGATICVVIGAFIAAMGNWFGKLRRNLYVGIRTPWTIMNDEVWERTHRLGGRMWVAIGLATLLSGLLLPGWVCFFVLMGGLLSSVVVLFVYSARIYESCGGDQSNSSPREV